MKKTRVEENKNINPQNTHEKNNGPTKKKSNEKQKGQQKKQEVEEGARSANNDNETICFCVFLCLATMLQHFASSSSSLGSRCRGGFGLLFGPGMSGPSSASSSSLLPSSAASAAVAAGRFNVQLVRHAGGGGRPGGRPAFNWREKQQLRLSQKNAKKELKLRPFGSWLDIQEFFDEKSGATMIEPSKVREGVTIKARDPSDDPDSNTKKVLSPALLFGPQKSYGYLRGKATHGKHALFSHKRIFGERRAGRVGDTPRTGGASAAPAGVPSSEIGTP